MYSVTNPSDMELPHLECLAAPIVTEVRDVFVDLAFRAFLLRWIRGGSTALNEAVSQDQTVLALDHAVSRLSTTRAFPRADEKP